MGGALAKESRTGAASTVTLRTAKSWRTTAPQGTSTVAASGLTRLEIGNERVSTFSR